jgi:UDP-glucose 4-epimerase
MSILITGGAGYIGSVMVEILREEGQEIIVLDNLFRGHRAAVAPSVPFYEGNIGDRSLVARICRKHEVSACIHFAALAYVGESVRDPKLYYENNVERGIALLDALTESGVKQFVFSSTCATYGEPQYIPIDELHPQQPTNPYGWSKLMLEKVLNAYDEAYGLKHVALRYFNASGAIPGRGEHHEPETHLIPNVLAAATGKIPYVSVFGGDYPTPDGTAIRDYIHVADLGAAHILALNYLRAGGPSEKINLGSETGYSVMELIEAARKITGKPIEVKIEPRRPGDPSRLVANAEKAHETLGWRPKYPELETIIQSAWNWHQAKPQGYDQVS